MISWMQPVITALAIGDDGLSRRQVFFLDHIMTFEVSGKEETEQVRVWLRGGIIITLTGPTAKEFCDNFQAAEWVRPKFDVAPVGRT